MYSPDDEPDPQPVSLAPSPFSAERGGEVANTPNYPEYSNTYEELLHRLSNIEQRLAKIETYLQQSSPSNSGISFPQYHYDWEPSATTPGIGPQFGTEHFDSVAGGPGQPVGDLRWENMNFNLTEPERYQNEYTTETGRPSAPAGSRRPSEGSHSDAASGRAPDTNFLGF